MASNYKVTPVRRLLSNIVSHHEVLPRNDVISPRDFLNEIKPAVISFIRKKQQNKIQLIFVCELGRTDPVTGSVVTAEKSAFRLLQEPIYGSTDLEATYERMVAKMLESFSAFLKSGSGWTLRRIIKLDITPAKNRPVKDSSYIPLPKVIRNKGALINMENRKDNQCFKWAILRYLHPREKDPQRILDHKKHADEHNWEGIEFPTPYSERMYRKLERNNDISLLVFGHETVGEETYIIPLYVPTPTERHEKTVRLFFFKSVKNSHYCTVKSMSRLISSQTSKHKGTLRYVCDYCLNYFTSQKVLDKHTGSCSKYKAVKTEYPKPGKNILKFKNIQNCLECPIKIFFDNESILRNIDETRGNTKLHQRHVMSAFCLYPVSRVEGFSMEPVTYVAKDEHDEVDKILMENLEEIAKKVCETFKTSVPMIFDEDARKLHENLTVCFACGKDLGSDKVRDHCHYTDRYRGALHSRCNLKLKRTTTIPVLAHNNSGCDSHMFVKRLADTERWVRCISENEEKYITFSKNVLVDVVDGENVYVKLKFLDTFRFMGKSLSELVRTTVKFEHTDRYFTAEQQKLLRRKEVYPYDYMTDVSYPTRTTNMQMRCGTSPEVKLWETSQNSTSGQKPFSWPTLWKTSSTFVSKNTSWIPCITLRPQPLPTTLC